MINFAEPTISHLVSALAEAISQSKRVVPSDMHTRVVEMYNWMAVCERTELVYDSMSQSVTPTTATRFLRYLTTGPWSGVLGCFLAALLLCVKYLWDLVTPPNTIELCPTVELTCGSGCSDGPSKKAKKKNSKDEKRNHRT